MVAARAVAEAQRLIQIQPQPLDLLLTDVRMPGMSGRDLAESLSARQPGLRVLFVSGYSGDTLSEEGTLSREMELLEKPFTSTSLTSKVRKILEAAR